MRAFEDTWQWGAEARREFDEVYREHPQVGVKLQAMRAILGECGMLAYLSRMTIRLLEMRRVLKPNGSIYLHCDPTASHYLKIMMDGVFHPVGGEMRSEIIWRIGWVSGFKTQKRGWIRNHDTILYYALGNQFTFNKEYLPVPGRVYAERRQPAARRRYSHRGHLELQPGRHPRFHHDQELLTREDGATPRRNRWTCCAASSEQRPATPAIRCSTPSPDAEPRAMPPRS